MPSSFHFPPDSGGAFPASAAVPARPPRRGLFRIRSGARRAFTLVEAMVATTVFTMLALGIYSMLIKSYQLAALTRCQDDARAVLRTFADQFERLQTTELVGTVTYNRWLFTPSGGPTSLGLQWGALSNANVYGPTPQPLGPITLGGSTNHTPATVTRNVTYIDPTTGATSATPQIQAAGFMLQAVFTINFAQNGKSYSQSLTLVRLAP